MTKAITFRNKAIRAEKFFRRSDGNAKDDFVVGQQFEPDISIKLEDDDCPNRIKAEPFDEDPNYEFMQNIDSMISHPAAILSSPFVDVFSAQSEELHRNEERSRQKASETNEQGSFGSSSGVVRCKLCLKTFTSVSSHHNHMKTVHREMREDEMHKCRYCDRYFKLKIYLNRHIARIHGNKYHAGKPRLDLKRKSHESIFNKEDVSLYCEVIK